MAGLLMLRASSASRSTDWVMAMTVACGAANSFSRTIAEFEPLGSFKPVAMPGGAEAVRQPWRISMPI